MASLTNGRIPCFALAALLMAVAGIPRFAMAAPPSQTVEYKVKAAYLLNFTRYIEWPDQAFTSADSPVQLCILGYDPFGSVLEKTVAGRTSKGRRIEVVRLEQIDDRLHSCHVVFISQAESSQEAGALAKLQNYPVLTVGESPNFLQPGGMINLLIVDDNVHFEINTAAAARAGLKISSRILPLAKRVISDGG